MKTKKYENYQKMKKHANMTRFQTTQNIENAKI